MKKALIALAAIIFLIIFALIILPVFFKDDIKAAIDKEVDNSIDANVIYDTQNINLSFFKNFPNLSLSIDQFGIVGKDSFDGDTLAWVESFDLSIDLLSLVSGDQIKINAISINQTDILVKVLESGAANYDIAKESDSATDSERASQATTFNLKIQRWEINNASISYIDESQNLNAYLTGLTHSGNGDFSQDLFDIESLTSIESVTLAFDGIKYIDDRILTIDMGLNMNLPNQTYTFLENRVALNDFGFMFDGDINLDEADIITDLSFIGQDIDLKSLLSLIPQVYQQDLKAVKTKGDVSFKIEMILAADGPTPFDASRCIRDGARCVSKAHGFRAIDDAFGASRVPNRNDWRSRLIFDLGAPGCGARDIEALGGDGE